MYDMHKRFFFDNSQALDEWQTQNLARILCEVYAKLLGVLLQHWLMLLSCWDDPHHSSIGVAEIVREEARRLSAWLLWALALDQSRTTAV